MKTISTICLLFLLSSCFQNKTSKLNFLVGTWKMEGKEQYEFWEKHKKDELVGNAYTLNNGIKTITETLSIISVDNKIIYEATVHNQNDGKTVQFILNEENKDCLSFENNNHDFPKKIQYKTISPVNIEVSVLGENQEGFSYIQIKQSTIN